MKKSIIILAMSLAPLCLGAQNLNPEVNVTNEYAARLSDFSKKGLAMSVPDSLLRFDYHFDYTVFDSPYQGAYEFSPYSITIKPDAAVYDGHKLYLKGGLGYTLHPELLAVWSPVMKSSMELSAFVDYKAYLGQYWDLNSYGQSFKAGTKGYDHKLTLAADLRYYAKWSEIDVLAGYDGIFTESTLFDRNEHIVDNSPFVKARFKSTSACSDKLSFDATLQYRFMNDRLLGGEVISDHIICLDGTVAPEIDKLPFHLVADVAVNVNPSYWAFSVTPKGLFQLGPVDLAAGLGLGYSDYFRVHPDITASMKLFRDRMEVFAGLRGMDECYTNWDLRMMSHFGSIYGYDHAYIASNTVLDLYGGVRGRLWTRLQYAAKLGYKMTKDSPLFALKKSSECYAFEDYNLAYAEFKASWQNERLELSGSFNMDLVTTELPEDVFAPAPFKISVMGRYNWNKRIYAGAQLRYSADCVAMAGDGTKLLMPSYIDLGINGEYKINRRLSAWLKASNLLGRDIRYSPLHSEKGVFATVGATYIF